MELRECINFLLTTAQRAVSLELTQKLAVYDITPSQYGVLYCLWDQDGCSTPKHMAETLFLEMSTVSGILDRMQKKELIERLVNEDNRREIIVSLTKKGRELKDPILAIIDEVNEQVLKNFSEKESQELKEMLRHIVGIL